MASTPRILLVCDQLLELLQLRQGLVGAGLLVQSTTSWAEAEARVEWIDVLPRNPSGKVLKKDLREPYWVGHERRVN